MMIFKLRSGWTGGHVWVTVFSGEKDSTLANCGTLTMTMDEWQIFGAMLLIGAHTAGGTEVVCEGDEQVHADCEEGQGEKV